MDKIEIPFELIKNYFQKAQEILFNKNNCQIIEYDDYQSESFIENNNGLINSIKNNPIVYCIWTGDNKKMEPMYVGHAKKTIAEARIKNHLYKKSKGTGAKLQDVKDALKLKKIIGLSFITIEPDFMRKPIEDWLISENYSSLLWNINN